MSKAKKVEKTQSEKLDDVVSIATADGNADANVYMHGMANGLILAQSIIHGTEPEYLTAPPQYLDDKSASQALAEAESHQPG